MDIVAHTPPGTSLLNPDVLLPLALVVVIARTRHTRDRRALTVAAVALFATALPPLHGAAESSVTGHMIQHLVLVLVAGPCLGLVAARAPTRLRARPLVAAAARIAVSPARAPLVAGAIHAAVLAVWHLPGPYDAAVDVWWVHGLEHAALLGSAAWWWATVAHHGARRAPVDALVSLFVAATAGAAVGVLMMFAPRPLYAQGGLSDQQTAGAIMAGGMGLVLGATALRLGTRALEHLAAPPRARVPAAANAPQRGATTLGIVVACLATAVVGTVVLGAGRAAGTPDAGGEATAARPADDPSEILAEGRAIYGRDCASCHGADGTGSFRGTPLSDVGTAGVTYVLETGRMPIDHPDQQSRRSEPAYDEDAIEALVAHLDTLVDGPAARDPDLDAAEVARGGEHYRLHCAACHGAEGIGGALAFEQVTPSVLHATPADVANAVVVGPGAMPSFATTFDDEALADVAAYVRHLQDPPGPGIAVPGGRVGEGLVAWVIGVGVLVAGIFRLGRRT